MEKNSETLSTAQTFILEINYKGNPDYPHLNDVEHTIELFDAVNQAFEYRPNQITEVTCGNNGVTYKEVLRAIAGGLNIEIGHIQIEGTTDKLYFVLDSRDIFGNSYQSNIIPVYYDEKKVKKFLKEEQEILARNDGNKYSDEYVSFHTENSELHRVSLHPDIISKKIRFSINNMFKMTIHGIKTIGKFRIIFLPALTLDITKGLEEKK